MDLLTKEGYDAQWGVHVVGEEKLLSSAIFLTIHPTGTHLFTELLMPRLLAAAQASPNDKARIITTSSSGAYLEKIHWDTFVPGPSRTKLGTGGLYYQSKLVSSTLTGQILKFLKLTSIESRRKLYGLANWQSVTGIRTSLLSP